MSQNQSPVRRATLQLTSEELDKIIAALGQQDDTDPELDSYLAAKRSRLSQL